MVKSNPVICYSPHKKSHCHIRHNHRMVMRMNKSENIKRTSAKDKIIAPVNSHSAKILDHTQPVKVCRNTMAVLLWFVLLLMFFQITSGISHARDAEIRRFFRMGDGQIRIRNVHNSREAHVQLLNADGSLNEEGLSTVDKVFGFFQGGNGEHVSLRLIFLLDYFSDKVVPGEIIRLQSGYRDPEYNQKLRESGGNAALTSTHMDAMAIDFSIEGVAGKRLWEIIRREDCCGVGHYGGTMVHLDSGRPRFWEAATSKVRSGESEFNRHIYLSTYYDYYRPEENVRLTFSSVSNYPFGVKRSITIIKEGAMDEKRTIVSRIRADDECIPINDRATGKALYVSLPQDIPTGRYRVRVEFCQIPFPQMPASITSNPVEIVPSSLFPIR
jgi:uncharacterized protein YcbK (DUF882 family)